MNKIITCIECPAGCELSVDIENSKIIKVSGNKCPKGFEYAKQEITNPERILTSTVLTEGLSAKMVSVRTDWPIPKGTMLDAIEAIKRMIIKKPVKTGDIMVKNFLNLGVNLIATRTLGKPERV